MKACQGCRVLLIQNILRSLKSKENLEGRYLILGVWPVIEVYLVLCIWFIGRQKIAEYASC